MSVISIAPGPVIGCLPATSKFEGIAEIAGGMFRDGDFKNTRPPYPDKNDSHLATETPPQRRAPRPFCSTARPAVSTDGDVFDGLLERLGNHFVNGTRAPPSLWAIEPYSGITYTSAQHIGNPQGPNVRKPEICTHSSPSLTAQLPRECLVSLIMRSSDSNRNKLLSG